MISVSVSGWLLIISFYYTYSFKVNTFLEDKKLNCSECADFLSATSNPSAADCSLYAPIIGGLKPRSAQLANPVVD